MPSPEILEAIAADETSDPFLLLLTISHADLEAPLRFVRNYTQIVSRGATYLPFPFDFTPPGQTEDGQTAARIVIDNVDRRIIQTVRALSTPPAIMVEVIVASAPDDVEESLPVFKLRMAEGDRFTLSADLNDETGALEPACRWSFTPSLAPALYA